MGSMSLLLRSWVFCPTPPEESFPVLRVWGGGGEGQDLFCLECSKHALFYSYPSEDLIPISVTGQRSNSNDVVIGAPINGNAIIDHHFPTGKSDNSERREEAWSLLTCS
ncbi:hypothetical protein TNCV_98051 [Trichonephila clavipes]|nr:hypothetical protein TNCV_98051 [Trichonephila clavipes]